MVRTSNYRRQMVPERRRTTSTSLGGMIASAAPPLPCRPPIPIASSLGEHSTRHCDVGYSTVLWPGRPAGPKKYAMLTRLIAGDEVVA